MGGKPLTEPVVGIVADPLTGGYWEVASDGGLFAFDAPFEGSMGGKALAKPIVGMAFDQDTGATGRWRPTAGSSLSGAPPSKDRWEARHWRSPSWAWPATR